MIKVVDTNYSKLPPQVANVPASTTITAGSLLASDFTNKGLIPATAASTVLTIMGIATQSVASSASVQQVNFVPVDQAVYVVADCTNNTAANQLCIRHILTDANTIANTSTNITINTGVFYALGTVGAASDKKLYGYFIKVGQNPAAS